MTGVSKRFGEVVACDDITVRFEAGKVHGLLGENGAGKSTLVKILQGLLLRDEGEIELDGRPLSVRDPRQAADIGIGMVHQHFSLIEEMTVWENIALQDQGRPDRRKAIDAVREIGDAYGLQVDPEKRVRDLSTGIKQRVEIIKALLKNPRILILDEPTSVLTRQESEELFTVLREATTRESKNIILISHKLAEIKRATDTVTVLKRGRVVFTGTTADVTTADLARAMVGMGDPASRREVAGFSETGPAGRSHELSLNDIVVEQDGRAVLDQLSLRVSGGEIVGIAGVEGNGQSELGDVLSSLTPLDGGTIELDGTPIRAGSPGRMMAAGIAVIPEDRHRSGCALGMTLGENLAIGSLADVVQRGILNSNALEQRAAGLIEAYSISAPGPEIGFGKLSGGNQQKAVLARELARKPTMLIACYPTRGLDILAIDHMKRSIQRAAASGVGVLLISSDLDELLEISDRIAVLSGGRIVGELTRDEATPEALGLLMGGAILDQSA